MESSRGIKMEKTHEKQDSIKLSRTSKGLYSWDIKIYHDDNAEDTIRKIKEIDKKLKGEFNNEM